MAFMLLNAIRNLISDRKMNESNDQLKHLCMTFDLKYFRFVLLFLYFDRFFFFNIYQYFEFQM